MGAAFPVRLRQESLLRRLAHLLELPADPLRVRQLLPEPMLGAAGGGFDVEVGAGHLPEPLSRAGGGAADAADPVPFALRVRVQRRRDRNRFVGAVHPLFPPRGGKAAHRRLADGRAGRRTRFHDQISRRGAVPVARSAAGVHRQRAAVVEAVGNLSGRRGVSGAGAAEHRVAVPERLHRVPLCGAAGGAGSGDHPPQPPDPAAGAAARFRVAADPAVCGGAVLFPARARKDRFQV